MSFQDRFDKLKRITDRIKAETLFSKVGTFNPTVPETNMIHVYLKKSETCCENVRDGVYEKLGLKIFTRIRGAAEYPGGYRCYFEWSMGEANGSVNDESIIEAWKQFTSDLLDSEHM